MSDWLTRAYDPSQSDKPARPDHPPTGAITIRIFERESELKEAIKTELIRQLDDLVVCNWDGCSFRYVLGTDADPAIRMLIHHYLHLAREGDPKVQKATLDTIRELIDPPKGRVTTGEISGVLSDADRKALQLEDGEF